MKILITGAAGFIGMSIARKLLLNNISVIGVDNLNNYYDTKLKKDRLKILKKFSNFKFYKEDILSNNIEKIFIEEKPSKVMHLAAQPGVRYSTMKPHECTTININGFLNIITLSHKYSVENFVYASSSSIYGSNNKIPYVENEISDFPKSIYAASKKSNELIAHAFSSLYEMRTIGIRYFTVYGPWGRPDMAAITFIKKILSDKEIHVFNNGNMKRDFTYIDDIVDGSINSLFYFDKKNNKNFKLRSFNIINLGNSKPISLFRFIRVIEKYLNKKAKIKFFPMQLGDVKATYANIDKAKKIIGYNPKIDIDVGIKNLVRWYQDYYLNE